MATFVASQASAGTNQGNQAFQLDAGNGSNRAAVIHVAAFDAGQTVTFAVSAGGVAAGAPVVTQGNTSVDGLLSTYVITGIPTGTITIQVNPSQTCDELFVMASTWSNVPQDTPVTDSASASGTSSTATIPAMTVGEGEVGIGALYYYINGNSTAVPSDTGMDTFPGTAAISGASHQYGDGTLSWTGLTGGSTIWLVNGIVLGHDEDEPPEITAVDGDNTISSDQTGVVITGANFDNATVEIRQDSVTVQQSIDSQSATTIQFDVVFDVSPSASLRHGAATLAVINQDDQEDTIGITIEPPSGHLYVDIATPNTEADNRITAVPDIESGDQIQARGEGGGPVPTGLTLNDDGTFEFSPGNTPSAFDVRVWDVNDATWGAWATQSIIPGGEIELAVGDIVQFQALDAPTLTQTHELALGGLVQSQVFDAPDLTQDHQLLPADLAQEQIFAAPGLTQDHQLSPADLAQEQVFDAPDLTQSHQLSPGDVNQLQTFDAPTITQDHQLSPGELAQEQVFDSPTVSAENMLTPNDLAQLQAFDGLFITQDHQLAVADLVQVQAFDAATLAQAHQLTVGDIVQLQALDAPSLSQEAMVSPQGLAQAQVIQAVAITHDRQLAVVDLVQLQAFDPAGLTQTHILSVSDIAQLQVIGGAAAGLSGYLVVKSIRFLPALTGALSIKPTN